MTRYFASAILSVAGLTALAWALFDLRFAVASLRWPLASGEVTSTNLRTRWRKSLIPTWQVHLLYTYAVGRQVLTGERIFFGEEFCTSARAVHIANRYPPHTPVQVHYDPKRLDRAVLEPGLTPYPFYGLVISIVLIGMGLVLLVR